VRAARPANRRLAHPTALRAAASDSCAARRPDTTTQDTKAHTVSPSPIGERTGQGSLAQIVTGHRVAKLDNTTRAGFHEASQPDLALT